MNLLNVAENKLFNHKVNIGKANDKFIKSKSCDKKIFLVIY